MTNNNALTRIADAIERIADALEFSDGFNVKCSVADILHDIRDTAMTDSVCRRCAKFRRCRLGTEEESGTKCIEYIFCSNFVRGQWLKEDS